MIYNFWVFFHFLPLFDVRLWNQSKHLELGAKSLLARTRQGWHGMARLGLAPFFSFSDEVRHHVSHDHHHLRRNLKKKIFLFFKNKSPALSWKQRYLAYLTNYFGCIDKKPVFQSVFLCLELHMSELLKFPSVKNLIRALPGSWNSRFYLRSKIYILIISRKKIKTDPNYP